MKFSRTLGLLWVTSCLKLATLGPKAIAGVVFAALFSESFAYALPLQTESTISPTHQGEVRHVHLGLSGFDSLLTNHADNLGIDPSFANVALSASSASIESFIIDPSNIGPSNQILNNESRNLDNLRASITTRATASPGLLALLGLAVVSLACSRLTDLHDKAAQSKRARAWPAGDRRTNFAHKAESSGRPRFYQKL